MHERLSTALRMVRCAADRPDPTEPLAVGTLAELSGTSTSSASRTAAALDDVGLLGRAEGYGAYRIGERALALSGAAAAPWAVPVDFTLTRLAASTRETVCLVAPAPGGARVVASVASSWTVHVAARVGSLLSEPGSAAVAALHPDELPPAELWTAGVGPVLTSTGAESGQVAVPVLDRDGTCVAALVVCFPLGRAERVEPVARRALLAAREQLRTAAGRVPGATPAPHAGRPVDDRSSLALAAAALEEVAAIGRGPADLVAVRLGARTDRVDRVLTAAVDIGLLRRDDDGDSYSPSWSVHGWQRAVAEAVLGPRIAPLVTAAARDAGTTAYLTVRRGLRSTTVAEAFADGGLTTQSWLGRPAQIVGADGGALLVMDLDDAQISAVLPERTVVTARRTPRDLPSFLAAVAAARREDRLVLEDFGEDGLTSVAAPVRGAAGTVVAAACLVGPSERIGGRLERTAAIAARLAADVSALLGGPGHRAAGRRPSAVEGAVRGASGD